MAVREANTSVIDARPIQTIPKSGCPALCKPRFDCKVGDKYKELSSFEIGVKNIFLTNYYNTQESKRVPIILNSLCQEGSGLCKL